MDGLVEGGEVYEGLLGEVMALRSRQTGSISLSSGAYFGSHSTVSQCARAVELCGKIGDGVNQAADLISATASIPSLNFIPLTTFGNWF